jgi:hypothetical protein
VLGSFKTWNVVISPLSTNALPDKTMLATPSATVQPVEPIVFFFFSFLYEKVLGNLEARTLS